MRGGAVENPQFGCKVDNKYELIADAEDPFEALDRLGSVRVQKSDIGRDKGKLKASGEAVSTGSSAKKGAEKKDVGSVPKAQLASGGKHQDVTVKKYPGSGMAIENLNFAFEKPVRAENQSQEQRRQRGGSTRVSVLPQQAGVVGLTPVESATSQETAANDEQRATTNAEGFQSQRGGSNGYRGRRGGPRGGGYYSTGLGNRRPRGGPRYPSATSHAAGNDPVISGAEQATTNVGAENDGEQGERVESSYEQRKRPYGFGGGYRGGYSGYGRRGNYRRGASGAGSVEDASGRKREFDRHSGSEATVVKAVDKKEGSGQHNWGTFEDDLVGQTEGVPEEELVEGAPKPAGGEAGVASVEKSDSKVGEAWTDLVHADESAKAAESSGETVQQDKMYVLDDWKAKEEKERFRVPEFNVRKPNEGIDPSAKWDGFILKKRETEVEVAGEEDVENDDSQQGADGGDDGKRKVKQRLNIPVKFATASHRGRGNFGAGIHGGPRNSGAPSEYREAGEQRESGAYRGGFSRPRYDRGSGHRGGHRGGYRGERAPGTAQGSALQLTLDDFPSLNK